MKKTALVLLLEGGLLRGVRANRDFAVFYKVTPRLSMFFVQ